MIVATAGHIDHGKTRLVKMLTGVDTDRLPEEKARGISIDIGYAYIPLAEGGLIGFVDVPGHERFIRNMLAGVCGIDFALLVIAADDGVMPQTVEHLQILDLLQVGRAAAVITKTDRVDAGRVREVQQSVADLLASTQLARAPLFCVSAVTGSGIETLRMHLTQEATRQSVRDSTRQHFRYAVDRAFSVAGSGTVVTGTIFNGAVRTGDKLLVSPAGSPVRVRGIQIHGKPAERAIAGERCALNLAGGTPGAVHRGDWVLAGTIHRPTKRIDARVKVLNSQAHVLRHWMPVHLHLATSRVTARVATGRGATVAAGETAIVQLVLDQPVCTLRGDRFILRDQSAIVTLGGGIVLDPFGTATRRSTQGRLARLTALAHDSPEQALAALLDDGARPVDLAWFELVYNLTSDHASHLYGRVGVVQLGKYIRVGVAESWYAVLRERILSCVADFHCRQPQAVGVDIAVLRQSVAPDLTADAFGTVLRHLADERRVAAAGATVRLPNHDATANADDEKMWRTLQPVLDTAGFRAPLLRDLAASTQIKDAVLKDFLHRKSRTGEVIRVGTDRFYLRSTLATLAAVAQATAHNQPGGRFTPAQYRDSIGIGRSLAMEILDTLDRLGITQRNGDVRRMRNDYVPILGPAAAQPKAAADQGSRT